MCNNSNSSSNLPLVVCISTPERKGNYKWLDGGSLLASPKIQIWSLDDVKEMRGKGILIPSYTDLNDLLILHPYETSRYIHIEDLEKSETKAAKFFKYKEILQELGAVSYKVVSGTKEEYERDTSVNVGASYKVKPAEAKVDVEDKESFTYTMGFGLEATFDGVRTISDQSYQNAKKLIEKYRLEDDIFINTLVNARDPRKENHQRTEHLQYKAMQEFNRCVDVAVAFSAVKIFDFSTTVKNTINKKVEYSLVIDIEFPEQ